MAIQTQTTTQTTTHGATETKDPQRDAEGGNGHGSRPGDPPRAITRKLPHVTGTAIRQGQDGALKSVQIWADLARALTRPG